MVLTRLVYGDKTVCHIFCLEGNFASCLLQDEVYAHVFSDVWADIGDEMMGERCQQYQIRTPNYLTD